jgi:hypothetical protein
LSLRKLSIFQIKILNDIASNLNSIKIQFNSISIENIWFELNSTKL